MESYRILLSEKDIPTRWYNIAADVPGQLEPPRHPGTGEVLSPDALAAIFPEPIVEQEISTQRWIDIPDDVLDIYRLWRPTPLVRAFRLEKALGTPARIYYKNESVSPAGSHKPNTAVPQAYYNKIAGTKRLATETGAGQWGCALTFACNYFDLECVVYMVKCSYDQKPYRRSMMNVWGGKVIPSPSTRTKAGQSILDQDPESPGSLGIAISEAVEDTVSTPDTKYALGSVANHVLLHQTIIGLEAQKQMEIARDYPDVVIGCHGGGSNFAGLSFPFIAEKLQGNTSTRFVAVEPAACPTLTRGEFCYDFGDTVGLTPLFKMFTLGHSFVPSGIHAGGLRYHGAAPLVSALLNQKLIEAQSYHQRTCFEAAVLFAQTEGLIPAPESSHAIRCAIDEALDAKKKDEPRSILFNLSGHGLVDMFSYDKYFSDEMVDYELPRDSIDNSLSNLKEKIKV